MLSTPRIGTILFWLNRGAKFSTFRAYACSLLQEGWPIGTCSWCSEMKNCAWRRHFPGKTMSRRMQLRLRIILYSLYLKSSVVFIRNCGSRAPSGRSWCANIFLDVLSGKMWHSDSISSLTRRVLLSMKCGNCRSSSVCTNVLPSFAVSNFQTKLSEGSISSFPLVVVMLSNMMHGKSVIICSDWLMLVVFVFTVGLLQPEPFPCSLLGFLL